MTDNVAAMAPLVPRMLAMATVVMQRAERNGSAEDLAAVAQVVNATASWAQVTRERITRPEPTDLRLVLRDAMLDNTRRRRSA